MSLFQKIKFRIISICVFFIFFLGALLLRSYQLQILENSQINRLAQSQYKATLPVNPKRGTIYDRNGEVLAMDVQVASIAIHPRDVKDPAAILQGLSGIGEITTEKINEKLKSEKKFEWLARRISQEDGEKIAKLKLKGVSVFPEYRRYYPNKELAGNILGAVGYDAKALGGLELALDGLLRSSSASFVAEKDAKGRVFTPFQNQEDYHNITLTLDKNIQFMAEKYLWAAAEKNKAKSGFAIVSDPNTGELLAMANYPRFNPNVYWEYSQDRWKNRAVQDTFEPGSTFKAVIAAAALKSGKISPQDSFYCEGGTYHIGKRTIHDHEAYQNLTVGDIIRVSSNIGVTKISQKIGKDIFYQMITALGFGKKSGVELPGEERGLLRNAKNWSDIDFSNISFGQGLTVNGIQMAMAYGAFANGGFLMQPFFISKIETASGELKSKKEPVQIVQVMERRRSEELTKILEGVVTEKGTGKLAHLDGYGVAGKTGTAQKVNSQTRSYDTQNYVSSFIGYTPTKKPEFLIYVVFDSPRPVYAGGLVAAPVFKEIAKDALAYKGIAPSDIQLASSASSVGR